MTMIHGAASGGSVRLTPTPAWLSPTSYWQPAHIVTSAWLEHAPFAFWLVDAVRPRSVVELGTHHGFSCFVFAEAVKRLGLDADIQALDTWAGDDQAGFYGEEVYASVRAIVESDYPGRVHLLRGWFADSRPAIGDGTVDLLHIDGRHGYDDVREDFEEWITVVRDGGIVLFHDIEERENGFGVWRLWEELAAEHPSFAFTHGHGLGIIGVGAVESDAVRELFAADAATRARIRAQYEALGAVVSRQAALEAMPAEIESLHALVASLDDQVSRLRDEVRQGEDVVSDYRQSTSWRITRPLRAIGGMLHRDR